MPAPADAPILPLRILLVLTRDPRGRSSGRKMVLRTILRSLQALGHGVTVAHYGEPEPEPDSGRDREALPPTPFHALPAAGRAERLVALAGALVFARTSANEALYRSRRADRALAELIAGQGFDLIVTDMIRTARHGADSGLPWIADLDDLLSARYDRMAADPAATGNIMGYLHAPFLRRLLPLAGFALPLLLRREVAILRRRERDLAGQATVVTLVSAAEAAALSAAAGHRVVATPMAVAGPLHVAGPADRPGEMVFLGGMDYGPNLTSLRGFDQHVRPAMMTAGLDHCDLDVIGVADVAHRQGFSPAIRFQGYADDLDAALQGYRILLVPEMTPGGIKTKIIAAALNGTVVLAHVSALEGMEMTDGHTALAWSSAVELAALIGAIRAGRLDTARIADNARLWAVDRFGEARLRILWHRNIQLALGYQPRPVA